MRIIFTLKSATVRIMNAIAVIFATVIALVRNLQGWMLKEYPRLYSILELSSLPASMVFLYLISMQISPIGEIGYALGFVNAFIALLLIPGYVTATALLEKEKWSFLALVPVLGFGFQLLIIELTYVLGLLMAEGRILLTAFIAISSGFTLLIRVLSRHRDKTNFRISFPVFLRANLALIALLGIGLAFRIYFLGFSYTPAPDGSLYLSQARNVVINGELSADVSGDSLAIPLWSKLGLSTHPFAVHSLILFFWMGGASYFAGKIMAVFSSLMLVSTSYYLARIAFGRHAAIIAGALVALHPWLVFWSVVLYGPEILASLWLLTFLLLLSLREVRPYFNAISLGLVLILLIGSEYPIGWAALLSLPLLLYFTAPFGKSLKIFLASIILVLISAPSLYFGSRPDFFLLTEIPVWYWLTIIAPPAAYLLAHLRGTVLWVKYLLTLFVILDLGLQALLARAYELPRVYSTAQLISVSPSSLSTVAQQFQGSLSLYGLLSGQSVFWQLLAGASGLVIFSAGLFSFFSQGLMRQRLLYASVAAAGSLIYTIASGLTSFITPDWWNYRLVLSFVPAFAILTASVIDRPIFSVPRRFHKVQRINYRVALGSIFVLIVLSSYIPTYSQIGPALGTFGHEDLWAPVATWVKSTQSNAIFLSLNSYIWNWLTFRPSATLHIDGDSLDMGSLLLQIRENRADYVILDSVDARTQKLVATYFSDPLQAPYGFALSFANAASGIQVLVYDVHEIKSLPGTPSVAALNSLENAEVDAFQPDTNLHGLQVLTLGWSSSLNETRVYLKFNGTSLPANIDVLDVRLVFFVAYSYASQQVLQPLWINARYTGSSWSEQNLTWSNQPQAGQSLSDASLSYDYRGFVSLRFKPGINLGQSISVVLLPVGIPTMFRYSAIVSKEGAVGTEIPPPSIEVIYMAH